MEHGPLYGPFLQELNLRFAPHRPQPGWERDPPVELAQRLPGPPAIGGSSHLGAKADGSFYAVLPGSLEQVAAIHDGSIEDDVRCQL